MSDGWNYDLYFAGEKAIDRAMIERAISILGDHGLRPPGEDWQLHCFSSDAKTDRHRLHSFNELMETAAVQSGLFSTLVTDNGSDVCLDTEHGDEVSSLGLYLGRSLRENDDEQLAKTLLRIFRSLCAELRPEFGGSYSVYEAEGMHRLHLLPSEIVSRRPPSQLFWLNYFSREYGGALPARLLDGLPGTVEKTESHGVFVQLCKGPPWESALARLDGAAYRLD